MAVLQSFNRGVHEFGIATWTNENVYGTLYKVKGIRNANLQWVVETDELRGDDVVLDRYTKLVSATLTVQEAVIDLEAFDMILGSTLTSSAAYYDVMVQDSDVVPYVAVVGRTVGNNANASGQVDLHFFLPKAKLSGNFQLNAQEGNYLIPQWDMQGVNEGTINGMLRLRQYTTPHNIALPLATS